MAASHQLPSRSMMGSNLSAISARRPADPINEILLAVCNLDNRLTGIVSAVNEQFTTMNDSFNSQLTTMHNGFNSQLTTQLTTMHNSFNSRFDATDTIVNNRFNTVDNAFQVIGGRFNTIDNAFQAIDRHVRATETSFTGMNRSFRSIGDHFILVGNRIDQVERQLHRMNRNFTNQENLINNITIRQDTSEFNFAARLENRCASSPWSPLRPLKTPRNELVPGFPPTRAAIDALDEYEISSLLVDYNLPTTGDLALDKLRFAHFIGITLPPMA